MWWRWVVEGFLWVAVGVRHRGQLPGPSGRRRRGLASCRRSLSPLVSTMWQRCVRRSNAAPVRRSLPITSVQFSNGRGGGKDPSEKFHGVRFYGATAPRCCLPLPVSMGPAVMTCKANRIPAFVLFAISRGARQIGVAQPAPTALEPSQRVTSSERLLRCLADYLRCCCTWQFRG